MVQIFAGVDPHGALRFISEVPSGLACNCVCLTCGARLVARKGEINDPHFGHESGQQRPECLVGARNLVRRIISEHFQAHALPAPSVFETMVRSGSSAESASWNMKITHVIEWRPRPGPDSPAALLALEHDYRAELIIVTDGEEPSFTSNSPHVGRLVLQAPMPSPESLRSKDAVTPYLVANMRLRWVYLPDAFGVIESTNQRLEQKQRVAAERAKDFLVERQRLAGQRWAQVRSTLRNLGAHGLGEMTKPLPIPESRQVPSPPVEQTNADLRTDAAWARCHVPQSGIFCYVLSDESQWVLIRDSGFGLVLRQYPEAQEGWDECFPPSVGRPDVDAGGYLVANIGIFFGTFGRYFKGMGNTSSPEDVPRIFEGMVKSRGS